MLVTRWDMENARSIKNLLVEEVIWFREMDRELGPAVQRACSLNRMRALAEEIRDAEHIPPPLRQGLVMACDGERPILTVNTLAAVAKCSRSTLWRHWRSIAGDPPLLRLEDLLHWLLLLRASTLKDRGFSWPAAATRIGIHPHTLGQLAKEVAGDSLRGLEASGSSALAENFREQVLDPLLRNEDGTK